MYLQPTDTVPAVDSTDEFDQTAAHDHRPGFICPLGDWPPRTAAAPMHVSPSIREFMAQEAERRCTELERRIKELESDLEEEKAKSQRFASDFNFALENSDWHLSDFSNVFARRIDDLEISVGYEKGRADAATKRCQGLERIVASLAEHIDALNADLIHEVGHSFEDIVKWNARKTETELEIMTTANVNAFVKNLRTKLDLGDPSKLSVELQHRLIDLFTAAVTGRNYEEIAQAKKCA